MNISATSTDEVEIYGDKFTVPGLSSWLEDVEEQGFVVVPDWLDAERVERLAADLKRDVNPIRELMGDGHTVRAHNLLAKTRCVDDLVCDPRLMALAQGVLGYQIQVSVVVMFDLLPGAKAQGLHQDDGLWPVPRPHPPFSLNAVIAVDDFTKANGATMLVPGSHKWHGPTRAPAPRRPAHPNGNEGRLPPRLGPAPCGTAAAPTPPPTKAAWRWTSTSTSRTSANRKTNTSASPAKKWPRCQNACNASSATNPAFR